MAHGSNISAFIHWDEKDLHATKVKSTRNITLKKNFALTCRFGGSPGTWEVAIQCSKTPPFSNFKMLASLKRTDDGANVLDAFLSIALADFQGKRCPILYNMDHVFEGKEEKSKMFDVDNHFECLFTKNTLPHDVLVIKAKLLVKGCQCQSHLQDHECVLLSPKL